MIFIFSLVNPCALIVPVLNFRAVKFKSIFGLHLLVSGAYLFMLVLPLSQNSRTPFHSHFLSCSLLLEKSHLFFRVLVCGFPLSLKISDLCDSYSCLCLFFTLFNSLFLEKMRWLEPHTALVVGFLWYFVQW